MVDAAANPDPYEECPWLRVYLASMPGDEVEAFGSVTRMTMTSGGVSVIAIPAEGDLRIAT